MTNPPTSRPYTTVDPDAIAHGNAAWSHAHAGRLDMAHMYLRRLTSADRVALIETCGRLVGAAGQVEAEVQP